MVYLFKISDMPLLLENTSFLRAGRVVQIPERCDNKVGEVVWVSVVCHLYMERSISDTKLTLCTV